MKWLRLLAVIGVVALVAGWIFRERLLNFGFDVLVKADPPSPADLVVVLGGDSYGKRLTKGAELVRQGFAPAVMVSGPLGLYGNYECDLAIPWGVAHGFPATSFRHFHGTFMNTADESAAIVQELRKENVKRVLIVTSGYHTRRASRYFEHLDGLEAHMVASPDAFAEHGTWWKHREGRKTIFLEWAKTLATWGGI